MKRFHVHLSVRARSDKVWSEDPQGTRWEAFHTFGSIATYHGDSVGWEMSSARAVDLKAMSGAAAQAESTCCAPLQASLRKAACRVAGCNNYHP